MIDRAFPAWRGIGRVRRTTIGLVLASLLVPVLLFVVAARESYRAEVKRAQEHAQQTEAILYEHALEVFQTQELVIDQVHQRIQGMDWSEIASSEKLHQDMAGMVSHLGQIDTLWLSEPNGETVNSSGYFPISGINVADRDYFTAQRKHDAGFFISRQYLGRLTKRPQFNVSRRISTPDGRFNGIISVSMSPTYFADLYASIERGRDDAIALIRADGAILTRYPTVRKLPAQLDAGSALFAAIRAEPEAGTYRTRSVIDGTRRTYFYRKLPRYPVYVVYGADMRMVASAWHGTLADYAEFGVPAFGFLLVIGTLAVQRATREERALAALAASEESQRALFRNAPVPMHALDRDRRILDVNERWLDLLGYARHEVVMRPITDFHLPGMDALHLDRWQTLLTAGELRDVDRKYFTKSGEVVEALLSATVERNEDGTFVRCISTVTDVTARRRAEEAARREQQFSELLIRSSTEGIIAVDRNLRYTLWNPRMEAISGIARERILGREILEMFPHLAGTAVEASWRAAAEGGSSEIRDWPYSYPQSGRSGFFDQAFAPLADVSGNVIGAIAFVHETTARHRAEEALWQAQKMEAIGQLTGGIAHDFNNFLTVIAGNLDLLRAHVNDDAAQRLIDGGQRGVERGARLTASLLAFARRQTLRPEIVDANRLIEDFAPLLRQAVGESIEIQLRLDQALHSCRIDPSQFETALLNLVVNARDAMNGAGGRIVIETGNICADERRSGPDPEVPPGRYVRVQVVDTAGGMAPGVLARAFEPFYTSKETGKGSGLGLSQVYGFVKQSGGQVRLSSELGVGTTVQLLLPSTESAPGARDNENSAARPTHGGNETILIVEDDEDVRRMIADSLSALGYRVLLAGDGPEALAMLVPDTQIDLIFSDIAMPKGISGIELARHVSAYRPDVKVLLTTGYASTWISERAEFPLLRKPYRQDELAARIRRALDDKDTGRARAPRRPAAPEIS